MITSKTAAISFLILAATATSGCALTGESGAGNEAVAEAKQALASGSFLDAGKLHACAIDRNLKPNCWGSNAFGQLGDGTHADRSGPVAVVGLQVAEGLSVGTKHSCAMHDGFAYCWGANASGQLGDGTLTERLSATQVANLSGVIQITAGSEHSCALDDQGAVSCWGENNRGQIGNGTTSLPVTVATPNGVTQATRVEAGASFSCAIHDGGQVSCWGANTSGQLGDGTTVERHSPVAVVGISSAVALTVGSAHACALLADQSLKCWGKNTSGELGTGSVSPSFSATPLSVVGVSNAQTITSGYSHTCVTTNVWQTTYCWGANGSYQLGDGTNINRATPVTVSGTTIGLVLTATGSNFTCAFLDDVCGVSCWGADTVGQLGNGGPLPGTLSTTPVNVSLAGYTCGSAP